MRVKAWHFIPEDYRLRDGTKVKAGSKLVLHDPPIMCVRGYHGSRRVLDALKYAPGPIVCRVWISGEIIEDTDKIVGTEREIEWTLDATWHLHEFACWAAERTLEKVGITDERAWNAIKTKRLWLAEKATDAELAAARVAAWVAAWDAAWDAARVAARDAAWAAARDAAWAAARAAAWDTARDAAWAAARDAAWDAQNRKLTKMLMQAE